MAVLSVVGCSTRTQPPRAPSKRGAAEQIPVHLDLVLRIDLRRIREALPPTVFADLASLVSKKAMAPGEVVSQALVFSDTVWIGLRPSMDPARWDHVLVLEGDFSKVATHDLGKVFRPPRDLGGGLFVRDVWEEAARTEPARLYTYLEKRWLIASAAEVDALERVLEGGHYERHLEPKERGTLSFVTPLEQFMNELSQSSPRLAELLGKPVSASGWVDLSANVFELEMRIEFRTTRAAASAARTLKLTTTYLIRRLTGEKSGLSISQADSDLILTGAISVERLAALIPQKNEGISPRSK